MSDRKPITKKARFEVFKRDAFTCQYCGSNAPDVILEADHIKPVSKGGDNDISNLITSCWECNSGKGPRELDDDSVIRKQRAQLNELNERRLQLEMMLEWREGLKGIREATIDVVADAFNAANGHAFSVNDTGRRRISKWLDKFTVQELLEALDKSTRQYLRYEDDRPTGESIEKAFSYIPRIAGVVKDGGLPEHMKRLFYIRAILRNRLNYINERRLMPLLIEARNAGICVDWLTSYAKQVRSWSALQHALEEFIHENPEDSNGSD